MDTHSHHPDDLNDVERRLSAWRPSVEGLDADAMLFAAGRAVAPRRFLWPALASCLAVLAVSLGLWATAERNERLALDRQLRERSAPVSELTPDISPEPSTVDEPSPDGWLSAHRALEHGLDAWPPLAMDTPSSPGPLSLEPVFTVGQRDALLVP